MRQNLDADILDAINQVEWLADRLVLVVGCAGTGKTAALRAVAERSGYLYVAVGLDLSRELFEIPASDRPRFVAGSLDTLFRPRGPVVLLDNLEILFDPSLRLDPLRLLEGLSRGRTVVTAWSGVVSSNQLTYAEPGHPEYRVYPRGQLLLVDANVVGDGGESE